MKSGVYETTYGNGCEYIEGDDTAYDLDMGQVIPLEMVEWDKYIRDFQ
ncbi:MAG: hypothetical protein U9R01_02265 [candidate division WOR-3 bacterium]|nr:hypothetical protein [candidate division WOR-3 bacterium]